MKLTQEQIEAYETYGYILIEGLFIAHSDFTPISTLDDDYLAGFQQAVA